MSTDLRDRSQDPPSAPGLGAGETDELQSRGRLRRLPRGSTLFTEGDRTDHVALIVEGRAKVFHLAADGREIVLAIREAGDLVGEQAAIDGAPRSANAIALEPMAAVIIPAIEFRAFLREHPEVTFRLLKVMSDRLRESDRARIEFGSFDTAARVASKIVELADRFGERHNGSVRVGVSLTQDELAAWVGSSRESVSKALGRLRRRGYIETHRRGINVLDIYGLRRRVS